MMLSLDTAYRSFGGEVEASSTPTICRHPDSPRHQLSAIAPKSTLRPTTRDNQPSTPGVDGERARRAFRDDVGELASTVLFASGAAFSTFWTVNLWRGERLDPMTLNFAPLAAHRNSTLLSSITSGWNHSVPHSGQVTVPRLLSGTRSFWRQPGHESIANALLRSPLSGLDDAEVNGGGNPRFKAAVGEGDKAQRWRTSQSGPEINAGVCAFSSIGGECNLKAVALKALKSRSRLCEKDSQGTAAWHLGEEYAPPAGGAWPQSRSIGPWERHQSHLSQRGRAVRAQRFDRQHCTYCSRT